MHRFLLSLLLLASASACKASGFDANRFVRSRTVKVFSHDNRGNIYQGTGANVGMGLVVTVAHVVRGEKLEVITHYNHERLPAVLISSNPVTDTAVIKVTSKDFFSPAAHINDTRYKVHDVIYVSGTCLGFSDFEIIKTKISGFGYAFLRGKNNSLPVIFFEANGICPGYSGGGVFDSHGNLVGVTSMITANQVRGKVYGVALHIEDFKWRQ